MGIWLGKIWLGQKEDVSELKELIVNELRAGISQLSQESRGQAASITTVETEQSLSDS